MIAAVHPLYRMVDHYSADHIQVNIQQTTMQVLVAIQFLNVLNGVKRLNGLNDLNQRSGLARTERAHHPRTQGSSLILPAAFADINIAKG
jgi:hypothetical protein